MNIVVVKAGGTGTRMGDKYKDLPKQFIEVNNKPIIIYSLEAYEKASNVDKIIIACNKDYIDLTWDYCKKFNITKVLDIIEGGQTTNDSFFNGVEVAKKYMTDDDIILQCDAVRPLVSSNTVNEIVEQAKIYGAAGAAIATSECLFHDIANEKEIYEYLGVGGSYLSKTPQGIKLNKLIEYKKLAQDMGVYDDSPALCALTANIQKPYKFVPDSPYNIKITYENQLDFFKMIVENNLADKIKEMK